jgi:hypothetical protein
VTGGLADNEWLCRLLKISKPTLDRWRREGRLGITPIKIGGGEAGAVRWNVQEALEWVRKGCPAPEQQADSNTQEVADA